MLGDEDVERGGFGGAPKFPPSALLEALLRSYERTGDVLPVGGGRAHLPPRWPAAASTTSWQADSPATASTPSWVVPHFEKMLYDNALLLRAYAHWARRTGNPLARRVTRETARFMIDELSADGMFISSLDADADGRGGPDLRVDARAAARGSG